MGSLCVKIISLIVPANEALLVVGQGDKVMTKEQNDQLLTEIAKKHLNLETLENRNSDSLDFQDMAVWAIKDALQEAYEAGLSDQGLLDN